MSRISRLKNSRISGVDRQYHSNGRLKSEESYHKGRLHGFRRMWYASGQLKSEVRFLNGCLEGQRREWFEKGQPRLLCNYVSNRLEGEYSEFYPKGHLREEGRFLEGQRHGVFREYDEAGKLIRKTVFLRDQALNGKVDRLLNNGKLTARHIRKMGNTAVRRICLEEFGYERFLAQSEHDVLDTKGDEALLRVDWHEEEEPLYLVKVRCPSTGVFYTLRVPPTMRTVHEAVAWTFGLPEKKYQPHVES